MQQNMGMQGMNMQVFNNMQQGGMQNMQWANQGSQNQASQQPCGFSGMQSSQMTMPSCPQQTILAPMPNVQLMAVPAGMTSMSLPGMQLMPISCSGMMFQKDWNGGSEQPKCVVKNTFLHVDNQEQTSNAGMKDRRRESSAPPRPRVEMAEEEEDGREARQGAGSLWTEGVAGRQASEPASKNNGQYLLIPSANSLKAQKSQGHSLSMEQQIQQLQLEQQQLLAQHQAQQQALLQQQQVELMYQQQQLEALQHSVNETQGEEIQETDDEDCIGQYQHQGISPGPVAPTDGAMAWMTATLEGMQCATSPGGFVGNVADTGSTPEPCVAGKKKTSQAKEDSGSGTSSVEQAHGEKKKKATDPWAWEDGVVTVMVRQLPRQYTQRMLLQEVVRRGFEGLFDFLYLPYDFKKGINVGYGFINFTEPEYALQFRDSLDGQYLDKYMRMKGKAVRVHPAQVQGYEANYRHFAHTKTGQKQDPAFSPLFFSVQNTDLVKQLTEGRIQDSGSH
ncbi:unnamed protein product, partial [Effrenium voratum]